MAVDTPATIAVIGAGPIGLEAALYGRFLGYTVNVYERGDLAGNLRRWRHVRLFSPFGINHSPLGLAALRAQDPHYVPPRDDELLSGQEFAERYLIPLSHTDLLADSLQLHTHVLAIGRDGPLKGELVGQEERIDSSFRLLLRTPDNRESVATADVVIDASGVFGNANWLAPGGIPAVGEVQHRGEIEYGLPNVLGSQRDHYAGRRVLVVGAGFSAATTVVALSELARQADSTQVTWITRRALDSQAAGPVRQIAGDRLPGRLQLAVAANRLATGVLPQVRHWPGTMVAAIAKTAAEQAFEVTTSGEHSETFQADRIVANIGYRPDNRIYTELQVHECYATGGPMKLAAALAARPTSDCLDQHACGPDALINPEPDFYILGAKSYGRNSQFLISVGLEQSRELFTLIGDRPDLDLYQSIQKQRL